MQTLTFTLSYVITIGACYRDLIETATVTTPRFINELLSKRGRRAGGRAQPNKSKEMKNRYKNISIILLPIHKMPTLADVDRKNRKRALCTW